MWRYVIVTPHYDNPTEYCINFPTLFQRAEDAKRFLEILNAHTGNKYVKYQIIPIKVEKWK